MWPFHVHDFSEEVLWKVSCFFSLFLVNVHSSLLYRNIDVTYALKALIRVLSLILFEETTVGCVSVGECFLVRASEFRGNIYSHNCFPVNHTDSDWETATCIRIIVPDSSVIYLVKLYFLPHVRLCLKKPSNPVGI